jgi:uncharacterized protein YjiS (DUF1127 family)
VRRLQIELQRLAIITASNVRKKRTTFLMGATMLLSIIRAFAAHRSYRRAMLEMMLLSDRELEDIGMARPYSPRSERLRDELLIA